MSKSAETLRISQVMRQLDRIQDEYGDLEVNIYNADEAEYFPILAVDVTDADNPDGGTVKEALISFYQ